MAIRGGTNLTAAKDRAWVVSYSDQGMAIEFMNDRNFFAIKGAVASQYSQGICGLVYLRFHRGV